MIKKDDYVLGEPVEKFRITYRDYKTGERVNYMNIGFEKKSSALYEVVLLKRNQKERIKNGLKPSKGYFKVKSVMVRPIVR